MFWWHVLAGAIAGGITYPIIRRILPKREGRTTAATLTASAVALAVTALVRQFVVAPSVVGYGGAAEMRKLIMKDEVMSFLASRHPEIETELAGIAAKCARERCSDGQALAAGLAFGQRLGTQYLPVYVRIAPDDSLNTFYDAFLAMLSKLSKGDPNECVRWMFGPPQGEAPGARPATAIGELELTSLKQGMKALFRGASERPVAALPEERTKEIVSIHVGRILARRGNAFLEDFQMLASPHAQGSSPARVCGAAMEFYSEVSAYPKDARATVIRALFSSS
jgi:hypothetical protein